MMLWNLAKSLQQYRLIFSRNSWFEMNLGQDRNGNLAQGAIANMVDEMGYAVVHVEGIPISVSVNMSISYLSAAKVDDELEITSKVLGQKGGFSATIVLVRNKATGEIIAEGRHSLFNVRASKM
ncbi:hypothetical protein ACJRO7_004888 [Eucalyptus globulus]|uniref:Thioesterase domain-containing protein n=1 Tax=Eucalyptus globulus TaxID=34317 RepID=A0ABD3IXZ6_EUCGL